MPPALAVPITPSAPYTLIPLSALSTNLAGISLAGISLTGFFPLDKTVKRRYADYVN